MGIQHSEGNSWGGSLRGVRNHRSSSPWVRLAPCGSPGDCLGPRWLLNDAIARQTDRHGRAANVFFAHASAWGTSNNRRKLQLAQDRVQRRGFVLVTFWIDWLLLRFQAVQFEDVFHSISIEADFTLYRWPSLFLKSSYLLKEKRQ
jgi:hypothetical protein